MPDTPDLVRNAFGEPCVDSRKLFDPGPLPVDAPRMFAPLACGDIQTALAYLENATIRLTSASSQDEHFTHFEDRRLDQAIASIREVLDVFVKALAVHRAEHAPQERNDSR